MTEIRKASDCWCPHVRLWSPEGPSNAFRIMKRNSSDSTCIGSKCSQWAAFDESYISDKRNLRANKPMPKGDSEKYGCCGLTLGWGQVMEDR
ncbi:MAG: hypothetical protein NXI16_01385 [Alphaproteobacteria bacterium]|nr:hypothetical protein [Alphaproteobacteria bacterium]